MSPAAPTPRSFPARSFTDGIEETITSTTRFDFSSITPVSTAWPHIRTVV